MFENLDYETKLCRLFIYSQVCGFIEDRKYCFILQMMKMYGW